MKRQLVLAASNILVGMFVLTGCQQEAVAPQAETEQLSQTASPARAVTIVNLVVNGKLITDLDALPYIQDGRTMVSLSTVAKYLSNVEVTWNSADRSVDIINTDRFVDQDTDTYAITIWVDLPKSKKAELYTKQGYYLGVSFKTVTLDAAPRIENNLTMVPVSFIAQQMGKKVTWSGTTNTVYISD